MNQWTNTTPGYKTKTIKGEGFTVRIHRPELTQEAYKHRAKEVERVLAHTKGGVAV